ncbi:uncharacterized protein LOC129284954 isoform X2 [Prosopis cineraria]|uniref:uncharacterized protein LOC129284954 isoform X2 n=1 Tax=Prosopis cineraria TaxID=364024 RepID=UPI0024109001|nr:uncharacterized protein LOC129284954 isoform X2 [Prosopis cineraria]
MHVRQERKWKTKMTWGSCLCVAASDEILGHIFCTPNFFGHGPVAKLGVEEPYKNINGRVALSRNLEDIYDMLNQDLQRLLAIKEDKGIHQRHNHHDTTMVYRSWKQRVSTIVAEVDNLRAEYERKRVPKWRFIRRSSLGEKIAKRHNRVKDLLKAGPSMNILLDYKQPEVVLKVSDAPPITRYPTFQNVTF